jgi:hypothetical protein
VPAGGARPQLGDLVGEIRLDRVAGFGGVGDGAGVRGGVLCGQRFAGFGAAGQDLVRRGSGGAALLTQLVQKGQRDTPLVRCPPRDQV